MPKSLVCKYSSANHTLLPLVMENLLNYWPNLTKPKPPSPGIDTTKSTSSHQKSQSRSSKNYSQPVSPSKISPKSTPAWNSRKSKTKTTSSMSPSKTPMTTQVNKTLDTSPKWTSSTPSANWMESIKFWALALSLSRTGKMPTERKTFNTTWMNSKVSFTYPTSSVSSSKTTLTSLSSLKLPVACPTIPHPPETGKKSKLTHPDSSTKFSQTSLSSTGPKNSETWKSTKISAKSSSKNCLKSPKRPQESSRKNKPKKR